jgi:hypothetical protein
LLSGEATNTNFIVFGLTWANHYTTDAATNIFENKQHLVMNRKKINFRRLSSISSLMLRFVRGVVYVVVIILLAITI